MDAFDLYKILVNTFASECAKHNVAVMYNKHTGLVSITIGSIQATINDDGVVVYKCGTTKSRKPTLQEDISKAYSGL